MPYFIGIDVGTSAAKTVLFSETGDIVASASESYPLSQPRPGWAEQNPEDFWRAAASGIRRVLPYAGRPRSVAGVGVSGQMHGLVMLDEANRVVRPAILWCDGRTGEERVLVEQAVGRDNLIGITCNPALECFTAEKLLWVRAHEPEAYASCRRVLLPKDYVNFRLTGKFTTDVTDASGTQLLDVSRRVWSEEVLSALDIPRGVLPSLLESCEAAGRVTEAAAAETGLAAGTTVAAGAGDQAAAALGSGIVSDGQAVCNVGTSGVVFAHTSRPLTDKKGRLHTFCHAVPGCWHVMGVTQGAGLSMKWFKDNFYAREAAEGDVYDRVNADISSLPHGCGGLTYLPYLMGERTPHLDAAARGVFFGIDATHTRAHFARAVMEGVSYSLLDCLSLIRELGIAPDEIRLAGGGAKSAVWRQMLADVLGVHCVTTNSSEAGCLGAAILASVASGFDSHVRSAVGRMIRAQGPIRPDPAAMPAYRQAYQQYVSLYPALRPLFAGNK